MVGALMLGRIGAFLQTERGGWYTLALTALFSAGMFFSVEVSTWALSVEAIVLGIAVLVQQGRQSCHDAARDTALHAKIDELIRAQPEADDAMRGIEEP